MSITVLVVPADPRVMSFLKTISGRLESMQGIVGGLIEAISLESPPATMYINEEGKLLGMQVNSRATALLWVHNPAFRGRDVVVGNCFIAGMPDSDGLDTDVPSFYTHLAGH